MELKFVNADKMKTLEEYLGALVTGMISLKTLASFHERAVKIGLLKEDQESRCNTITWDFTRLMNLYKDQAESVLELLPDDFCFDNVIAALQQAELQKAKQIARKHKTKKEP